MPVTHHQVAAEEAEIRLDRWFKRHFPTVSHGILEKWLRTGQVRVDGKRAQANLRLDAGQEIRVPPISQDGPAPAAQPKAPPPIDPHTARMLREAILHIDNDVIVLNKPSGLAVQGGTGMGGRHLDAWLDALTFDAAERPRLVHRLDKDTSGVLVLGRSAKAAAALTQAFRGRDVRKCYWAVVVGVPKPAMGTIDAPLSKIAGPHGDKMEIDEDDGRHAVTWYRVVDALLRRCCWLEMEPRTGRTHQLRVHAQLLGTPIQGDGKYGKSQAYIEGLEISRTLHLHARALAMPHPSGGILSVTAPLPPHMAETFRILGFSEREAGQPFVAFGDGP